MKETESLKKSNQRKITQACTVITSDEAITTMKNKHPNMKKIDNKNISKEKKMLK